MIQLRVPSSDETREFNRRATLTVHYGNSLTVESTSVVHSFLRCILGLNECTREHPLWFRTQLNIAVPSNSAQFEGTGGDTAVPFGYSPRLRGEWETLEQGTEPPTAPRPPQHKWLPTAPG